MYTLRFNDKIGWKECSLIRSVKTFEDPSCSECVEYYVVCSTAIGYIPTMMIRRDPVPFLEADERFFEEILNHRTEEVDTSGIH